ncbi:unnamed protein product [Brassicogethes aeneus]|uniref:Uncharacterized protein n=1 Tax=Brassicogethes aeneus TaxID=1431903 RepID=A0A9P0BJ84_BRAAE|nr:unnamed protein product [Brassicogethes aeneus]
MGHKIDNIQLVLHPVVLMGFRVVCKGQLEVENQEVVDVTELRERIIQNMQEYQEQQKRQFDAKRCSAKKYEVGDLVLIRITSLAATGTSPKLLPKWRGPFRVSQVLDNDRFEVQDIPGTVRSRQGFYELLQTG